MSKKLAKELVVWGDAHSYSDVLTDPELRKIINLAKQELATPDDLVKQAYGIIATLKYSALFTSVPSSLRARIKGWMQRYENAL